MSTGLAPLVAGPFVVACTILVISGGRKLPAPGPVAVAIAAAGLPAPRAVALIVGAVELGTGVAGVVFGGTAALAVAFVYLALGGFALRLLLRAPATPCACLGSSAATVTPLHLFVDFAACGTALAAATGGAPLAVLAHRPFAAAAFLVLVACAVQLVALTLDALPVLQQTVKETSR